VRGSSSVAPCGSQHSIMFHVKRSALLSPYKFAIHRTTVTYPLVQETTGGSELKSNFGDTPYRSTARYVRKTPTTPMEVNTRIRPDKRSHCDAAPENPHHRRIHLYKVSRETTNPDSAGDWPAASVPGSQTIGSEKEVDQVSRETSCSYRPSQ